MLRYPIRTARRASADASAAALAALALLAAMGGLGGCATRSAEVLARPTDPAAYAGWDCGRLTEQLDIVQHDAVDLAYAVDAQVGNNLIALGIGVAVFWPALLAMRPDGTDAERLAEMKGRYEALRTTLKQQQCADTPEQMAAAKAAAMPVAAGDRLVYDERDGLLGPAHRLDLVLTALRRDQLEFRIERDGKELASVWRQDLAGNAVAEGLAPMLVPRRLLRRGLELGQVLSGELAQAVEPLPARVRAQVVAIGPQVVAGHNFDVAVLELFGDVPNGTDQSARVDGVLALDRNSGVLLRLELRSGSSGYLLRRRLMRIESRADAAAPDKAPLTPR